MQVRYLISKDKNKCIHFRMIKVFVIRKRFDIETEHKSLVLLLSLDTASKNAEIPSKDGEV